METAVIFFDGVCGLCNRFVDFVIARDSGKRFRLSPLQGETAKTRLDPDVTRSLETFVLLMGGRTYYRSDAVLRTLVTLGGLWVMTKPLLWIPRFIRDFVYNVVVKYRYQWFGKRETCRLPTPEERERFLP